MDKRTLSAAGIMVAASLGCAAFAAPSGQSPEASHEPPATASGESLDVYSRAARASELLWEEKYAAALEEYVWLWENGPYVDDAFARDRGFVLWPDIEELVREHQPARDRFTQYRDELADELRAGAKMPRLVDWLVLNSALEDHEAAIAWYDRVKRTPAGERAIQTPPVSILIEEALLEARRFGDWLDLLGGAEEELARIERRRAAGAGVLGEADATGRSWEKHRELGKLYAVCVGANREDQAKMVRERVIERLGDEGRMAMAWAALRLDVGTKRELRMVQHIESEDVIHLRAWYRSNGITLD